MKIKCHLTYLPAAMAGVLFVLFAMQLPAIGAGEILEVSYAWLPSLGIEFAFRLDGLSLLFSLLITGIGAMILSYAAYYFAGDRRRTQLQWLLSLFAISMLGLVLADDAIAFGSQK